MVDSTKANDKGRNKCLSRLLNFLLNCIKFRCIGGVTDSRLKLALSDISLEGDRRGDTFRGGEIVR